MPNRKLLALGLTVAGGVIVAAGVALIFVPAALILVGAGLIVAGLFGVDLD